MTGKIAGVFTTFNRCETCLECVRRLLAQERSVDLIVVVDNGSTDGTVEAVHAAFPNEERLRMVSLKGNPGNPAGIAAGMGVALEAGAEAVWILDDDSWPQAEALRHLLRVETDEHTVAGSLVLDPATGELAWPYGLVQPGARGIARQRKDLPDASAFATRGIWLGALVPRQVIEAVGLPDERLFLRGEDEEYPARIARRGYRFVCVRDSILEHPTPENLRCLRMFGRNFFYQQGLPLWKGYYMIRNQAYVRRKYGHGIPGGMLTAVGGIVLALGFAVGTDDRKAARCLTYLKAGWHGLTGRLGKRVPPPGDADNGIR